MQQPPAGYQPYAPPAGSQYAPPPGTQPQQGQPQQFTPPAPGGYPPPPQQWGQQPQAPPMGQQAAFPPPPTTQHRDPNAVQPPQQQHSPPPPGGYPPTAPQQQPQPPQPPQPQQHSPPPPGGYPPAQQPPQQQWSQPPQQHQGYQQAPPVPQQQPQEVPPPPMGGQVPPPAGQPPQQQPWQAQPQQQQQPQQQLQGQQPPQQQWGQQQAGAPSGTPTQANQQWASPTTPAGQAPQGHVRSTTPSTPAQQTVKAAASPAGATPPVSNSSMSGAPAAAAGGRPAPKRARPRKTPNKIDLSQVPTPCRDLPFASPQNPRPVVGTLKGYAPLSITHFVAQDEGSASAKFMRPTVHASPFEDNFLKDSGMPWSVVLSPLFEQFETDSEKVPLVTDRAPIRCHRCRAYITPQTPFSDLGKKWQCLFCGLTNDTDAQYYCNLDSYGQRRDKHEKPELSRGSVEYDVSELPEYSLKNDQGQPVPNRPMSHLFAIDVSTGSKTHLASLVDSLRANIKEMAAKTPQCRVSFITFADSLHFYNFSQQSAPMLCVPDVDAPFVPLPFTLLCWLNVHDDADRIDEFLDRVLTLPDAMQESGCCAGAAVKVASMILSETGGKVIVTASQAPNAGVGQVKKRDLHKLYTTENEKQLFKPVEGFWPSIAIECAKKQISVDVIAFPTDYCELVTMGYVPHLTGGSLESFPNFSTDNDGHRLYSALARALLEEAGYGAIVRVRSSQGIRVAGYHGHFASNDPQDMDLAGISSSKTFVVDLKHEGRLDPKSSCYLQLALLYTTRAGARRVRVHTIRTGVCNTHAAHFRHADLEATLIAMLYHTIHTAANKGTKAAREELTQNVLKILVAYRRFCASSSHTGQLLLPEQLKLMPLYALCAMKSDALAPGCTAAIDQRTQSMFDLMSMPVVNVLEYLYPRLYALQTTLNHPSTGLKREDGVPGVYMPPLQQLTTDTIMCHGIYALLDRQVNLLYLWIGSGVSPRVSQALFNGEEDAMQVELSGFDTWHDRLKAVLSQIAAEGKARIVLVKEGQGGIEDNLFRCMLEDEAVPGAQTYSEFLLYLHQTINARLS